MPQTPALPPGFELESAPSSAASAPSLPPGFELEAAPSDVSAPVTMKQRRGMSFLPPPPITVNPQQASTQALAQSGLAPASPIEAPPDPVLAEAAAQEAANAPITPQQAARVPILRPLANPAEFAADVATRGLEPSAEPAGGEVVRGAKEVATPGKRVQGAARIIAGAAGSALPAVGPAALEAPVSTAASFAAGQAASEAAGRTARALGADPQTEELVRQAAFYAVPALAAAAHVAGVTGSGIETPQGSSRFVEAGGERTPEGQPIPGTGKVAVGVSKTPEEYAAGVKVGKTGIKVRIPRKAAEPAAPAIEPPTIEGEPPAAAEPVPSVPSVPEQPPVTPVTEPQAPAPETTPPVPAIRKGGKRARTPQETQPATLPAETPTQAPAAPQAASQPQEHAPEQPQAPAPAVPAGFEPEKPETAEQPQVALTPQPAAATQPPPSPVPAVQAAAKNTPESGAVSLANAVYGKLKAGESLGNVTEFNKLAEQHFGSSRTSGKWTPKDAFDAMEAGVNKYLLDVGPRLMRDTTENGLKELRPLMDRITSQGTRTEEQIKNQQFSTPPTEAYVAAKVAGIQPGDVVLEPSAGNGGLAVFAKAAGAQVHVNEIAPRRREMLKTVGFENPTNYDGELINSAMPENVKPSVVLMNPPFSASTLKSHVTKNRNKYGFNHVEQALQRLEPGGRLVAILGGGQANEPNGGAALTGGQSGEFFDRLAKKYAVRANVRVHGKEYQKYGTAFATRIVVVDKPAAGTAEASATGNPDWRKGVVQGNYNTLEEAYNALRDVAGSRPESGTSPAASSAQGARTSQPGAGVGAVSPSGGRSGNRPQPASGETPGAIAAGSEHGKHPGAAGNANPSPGPQPPPVRQQPRPAEPPQAAPAGRPEGVPESAGDKRQLAGNEAPGSTLDLSSKDQKFVPEENDSEGYVAYRPTLKGPGHPGSVVETSTMATVPLPPIAYKPALPESVVKDNKLSAVQLEPVALAGQQNDIVLPGGFRASMLVGDGTGVGKGRISAGILWDNWRQGRKRLVWVSEKWDLMQDAIRDLKGIGADELTKTVKAFQKFEVKSPIQHEGVLFSTYALIRSADKKGNRRVDQLAQWLKGDDDGEGAYILFDESHNLKNAVVVKGAEASQIGKAVKGLMAGIPKLRSVSLSATAATDVMNLGYLDRLGLWGPGTPFPNGFPQFANEIAAGGISAMEMVARELKAQGKYVSRSLSFKGVTYRTLEHALNADQKEMYRAAAKAWKMVSGKAEDTIKETTNGGAWAKSRFLSLFYSAQQRFFNVLLTTMKIPSAVQEANAALEQNKSVVITLVNTNEAAQNREKNRSKETESDLDEPPDYDFGPGEMLVDLVREHYPVQQFMDDVDENGKPIKVPVYTTDAQGRKIPVTNPEAVKQREDLIKELHSTLKLPANPLDMLINALGGPKKVAELTGRKERFDPAEGKFVPRGGPDTKRDEVNLSEMRAFQGGKKRVAILSSAAGTGISLHAGNDVANKQPRVHITLQVGWSADKQMQMFGRTHRTNEAHPPEYVMLASDLGGEKRFISTIARRLGSLGALSKGQRNANTGTDLMEKVNFETEQGRQATNTFYNRLLQNAPIPGTDLRGMQLLDDMAVLKPSAGSGETVPREDRTNVTKLLNRLLALDPDVQNAAYNYFYDIFQAVIEQAVQDGSLDTGVKTLRGDEFKVNESRVISRDPKTGAATYYYPVTAQVRTNRMPVKSLEDILQHHRGDNPRLMVNDKGKLLAAFDTKPIVHADGRADDASYVFTPARGNFEKVENYKLEKYRDVSEVAKEKVDQAEEDLTRGKALVERYEAGVKRYPEFYQEQLQEAKDKIPELEKALAEAQAAAKDALGAAKQQWQLQYEQAPSHVATEHHLIGGAVLRWWNPIKESTGERLHIYTASDSKSKQRVVGVEIMPHAIERLLSRISGGGSTVGAGQIIPDVLRNNLEYTLERGIRVAKGRVGRYPVVQFFPPSQDIAEHLKKLGVLYEKGAVPIYYLPNGTSASERSESEGIMNQVLAAYPVKESSGEAQPGEESRLITGSEPPGPGAKNVSEQLSPFQVTEVAKALKAIRSAEKTPKQQIKIATNAVGSAKESLTGAAARAQAVGAAIWNWYKNGAAAYPEFNKQVDQWIGAKQLSALEVRQLEREAYKTVPDRLTREAMVNVMETPREPQEQERILKERAEKAPLRWKDGYEKALNLTDSERAVVSNFRVLMDHALEMAQKNGVLENGVEDYIQHVWKRIPKKAQAWYRRVMAELNYSSLQPNPAFTRKRVWQTYYEGELAGAEPENKDAVALVGYHLRSLYGAIADRAFIRQLFKGKAEDERPRAVVGGGVRIAPPKSDDEAGAILVKPQTKKPDTADYVHIDHPALRRWKWSGEDDSGNQIFLQGDVFVHPEIARKLKNILGRSAIREFSIGGVRPGKMLLGASRGLKDLLLTAVPSFFHETTVRVHAAEHRVNPLHDILGVKDIDVTNPKVRKLITSGLFVYDGRGYENYSEGLAAGGIATKIPGYGDLLHWHQERLFGYVVPGLKTQMALHALERNLERYRGQLSQDEIYKLTANQANAAFGELNYDSLGRNKTLQDFMRLVLLAPDFLEARARFVGQALRPKGREQLVALALGAAAMYAVARVIEMLAGEKPHWDKPLSAVIGRHEFSLRSIQGDLLHLVSDPRQFSVVRLHPATARTILEFLSGRDEFGRKRDPWDQMYDFAKRNLPIPTQPLFTARGLPPVVQMLKSVAATFGLNEKIHRSAAEEEAYRHADESPSKASSRPQSHRMRDYHRQMNEGEPLNTKQLNQDVSEHKLTPQDRMTLLRQAKKPYLGHQLSEQPLPEMLKLWGKMTPEEQKQNRAIFVRGAYREIMHYPVAERADWRRKVDDALHGRNQSVVPAFVRRLFGSQPNR